MRLTQRVHLFPFRTQKLSSVVPKILGWKRPGKIGIRQHEQLEVRQGSDLSLFVEKYQSGTSKSYGYTEYMCILTCDLFKTISHQKVTVTRWKFTLVNFEYMCILTCDLFKTISHVHSSIAQSVEHLTVNQGVTGSSPVGGAIKSHSSNMHL